MRHAACADPTPSVNATEELAKHTLADQFENTGVACANVRAMARTCLRDLVRAALLWTSTIATGLVSVGCVDGITVHRLVRVHDDVTDDVDASSASDDDPQVTPQDDPQTPEASTTSVRESGTEPVQMGDSGVNSPEAASAEPWVRVGIPDAVTGIEFVAIEDGDDIPIQMGGQGGTHARIALSVSGFGNRIFYQVFLKNLDGEGEVATLPLTRARPVACDENDVCRVSPLFVLLGGLAPADEWEGLNVQATAVVSNADGESATGRVTGVLQWFEQDL